MVLKQNKDLSRKWYCQALKTFRIISSEIKILLFIISWWCFSCLHIHRIGIQYTDQLIWKTNFHFLFFFFFFFSFFWYLRNLVKCMDSMVPCYSLLNMKVIWLYMVSAPLRITMEGRDVTWWKFAIILWR